MLERGLQKTARKKYPGGSELSKKRRQRYVFGTLKNLEKKGVI